MGALHAGHLALVEAAHDHADHITVSIFVNPTQFGPNEDLEAYPRTLQADVDELRRRGNVDIVFAPSPDEMYPLGTGTWVEVEGMTTELCGRYRAGHFRGVTTVVTKLLTICSPDVAVLGRKDAQQFLVIRRLARDLGFDTQIIGVPTVREPDGLAMSSRNRYLTPSQRKQAVVLSEAVSEAHRLAMNGEQQTSVLVEAMRSIIDQAPDAQLQYAEVVDMDRIQPIDAIKPGQTALAAVAVLFGSTRLIDNTFIEIL
jgi:pantoate--beta-alanine ligase